MSRQLSTDGRVPRGATNLPWLRNGRSIGWPECLLPFPSRLALETVASRVFLGATNLPCPVSANSRRYLSLAGGAVASASLGATPRGGTGGGL